MHGLLSRELQMASRRRTAIHVCFDGDPAEQCSYVSYGGYFDARENGWPLHEHGRSAAWVEWAHGPAEKCRKLSASAT